ncbi:hypothetical protein [Bremerella sp. P1]|uniref:hypothetical protein n=1 Tax=Bremerella sp. P1 TaxID=3026424 RepID=UPI00236746C4|nr:hypothetical protein [Bremerella sp. P1]WDI40533.1 hypothetical protein PSR63_18830 [Bremerella sp. P1]
MTTIKRKVDFNARGRERKRNARPSTKGGRVPRVARLMALAIRLDHLIQSGEVTDQAELARVGHVTRARLTQIMNLLQLAPDIQEEILFLPMTERGRDPVTERDLRSIAAFVDWKIQRWKWKEILQ